MLAVSRFLVVVSIGLMAAACGDEPRASGFTTPKIDEEPTAPKARLYESTLSDGGIIEAFPPEEVQDAGQDANSDDAMVDESDAGAQ
jgi:hypothetical protein